MLQASVYLFVAGILIVLLQSIGVIYFDFPRLGSISALALGLLPVACVAVIQPLLRSFGLSASAGASKIWTVACFLYLSLIIAIYLISFSSMLQGRQLASITAITAYLKFDRAGLNYLVEILSQDVSKLLIFFGLSFVVGLVVSRPPEWLQKLSAVLFSNARMLSVLLIALVWCAFFAPAHWIKGSAIHHFFSPQGMNSFIASPEHGSEFESGYFNRLALAQSTDRPIFLLTVDALRADFALSDRNMPLLSTLRNNQFTTYFDKIDSVCGSSYCSLAGIYSAEASDDVNVYSHNLIDILKARGYRTHFILSGDHINFYKLRNVYRDEPTLFFDGNSTTLFSVNDDRLIFEGLAHVQEPRANDFFHFHLMSAHSTGRKLALGELTNDAGKILSRIFVDTNSDANFVDNYLIGVSQADVVVHEIVQFILDRYDDFDPIIVITADHGELLGESGRFGHGGELTNELTKVPLIVVDHNPRSTEIIQSTTMQSHQDIAPYLLMSLGLPLPKDWEQRPE